MTIHTWILTLLLLAQAGCLPPKSATNSQSVKKTNTDNSVKKPVGTTDLQLQLPPATSIRSTKSQITLNSIRFRATPTHANCQNTAAIDQELSYTDIAFTRRLTSNCSYDIDLILGQRLAPGPLVPYYTGKLSIAAERILAADGATLPVMMRLNTTNTAAAAGFPAYVITLDPVAAPVPTPVPTPGPIPTQPTTPTTPPTPNPLPQPSDNLPALPAKLQVSLTNASNQTVPLSSIFTTQYLLIDFSQPGCQPCTDHAEEANNSSTIQARFSGNGACKSMIVVGRGQLSDWLSGIGGASSFSGKSSYAYATGIDGFSDLFGNGSISATPTFILVDRTGRVIGNESTAESTCR